MSLCDNFTLCKPVGACGTRIWLGKNTSASVNDILFVKYYLGGNEVIEATTPIIEGTDVFLDLSDPYADFYNTHIPSYQVWLSDSYLSEYKLLTNEGSEHEGLILIFNGATSQDKAIICE